MGKKCIGNIAGLLIAGFFVAGCNGSGGPGVSGVMNYAYDPCFIYPEKNGFNLSCFRQGSDLQELKVQRCYKANGIDFTTLTARDGTTYSTIHLTDTSPSSVITTVNAMRSCIIQHEK